MYPQIARKKGSNQSRFERFLFGAYQSTLDPSLPFTVTVTDIGLGVVYKATVSEKKLLEALWGQLVRVDASTYQSLAERCYPSLFQDAVMVGPAALLNHACDAPFGFTVPKSMEVSLWDVSIKEVPMVFLKHLSSTNLREGDEVRVRYSEGSLWFECVCSYCLGNETDEDNWSSTDSDEEWK